VSQSKSLADLGAGDKGVIAGVQGGMGIIQRLDAMGLRPGVAVVKVSGHPFGGPVVVRTGNMRIALGFGMAKKILLAAEAPREGS
jgi:ferrous iron transport protein A